MNKILQLRSGHVVCFFLFSLLLAACRPGTSAPPTVITAAGAPTADIQAKVEEYKKLLGGADNGGTPGSQPAGFRLITWDAVPDEQAAPNFLPSDVFNNP